MTKRIPDHIRFTLTSHLTDHRDMALHHRTRRRNRLFANQARLAEEIIDDLSRLGTDATSHLSEMENITGGKMLYFVETTITTPPENDVIAQAVIASRTDGRRVRVKRSRSGSSHQT